MPLLVALINPVHSQVSINKKNLIGDWTTIDLGLDRIGLDTMKRVEIDWYIMTVNDILLQKDTLLFFTSEVTSIPLQNNVFAYFSLGLRPGKYVNLNYHMYYQEPPVAYLFYKYKWEIQKYKGKKYLVLMLSSYNSFEVPIKIQFEILEMRKKDIPESDSFFSTETFSKELLLKIVRE
ncbi:MAG: hypothetical protein R3D00_16545 [Bacteroidia bacterium]